MVTPEMIAVALGRVTPSEDSSQSLQWKMWIADATRAVERRAERLGMTLADLDVEDVDYVVRQSVVEMARNPDAVDTVDVRVDDGAVSRRYSSSHGRVTILDDWWALLGLTESSEAFSIRPSYTPGCPTYRPYRDHLHQW